MKKRKVFKRLTSAVAVISMMFVNLTGSGISVNAAAVSEQPVFEETECRRILVDESYDFDIKNAPSQATYQWKSSNETVAKVDKDGVVTAVAAGYATITCKITSGDDSTVLKAKVCVKEESEKPAIKMWINNKIKGMAEGETYNLNCSFRPSKVSEFVNWTSSDTTIAKVNGNGVVTALSKGTVTITATTLNRDIAYKIKIKVSPTVTVTSQKQLNQALKAGKASKIYINTSKEMVLTIKEGDYSGQALVIKAPNATIHNHGIFKSIEIRAIKDQGWSDSAKGNTVVWKNTTPIPTATTGSTSGGYSGGSSGGSSNPPAATPTPVPPTSTPTATPTPVAVDTKTDDKGFTSDGRIVAKYGTPKIDGKVDDVWAKAIEIQPPHINNAAVQATATFKVLWDENALYVLAKVKDPNMTLQPGQVHEKDSIEVFLDELNDKGTSYGFDDLQFRVNYENAQSAGNGDLDRFYTATWTGDGEYIIEARVELLMNFAANDIIYGMELQVNDGIGSSRAGTITVFDTTDSAWSKPSVFGEVVLTGKEPGDVPGLNPYKLIKLIDSAEKLDATVPALTDSLKIAKDAVANDTSTQKDIDAAFDALNNVIAFINAVTKADNTDLSVYQDKGLDVFAKAVEDAKKLLVKEGATADEMKAASDAIDVALKALKVKGLDDNGNIVAKFGSPVIDGVIDEVWDKVDFVPATASGSGSTDTTAKFKVLWDDKAVYVLADVTDNALDVTSGTVYNRDCVEILLDEGNNAVENIFDLDDRHYRISCENSLSSDRGSLDLLYTEVAKKKDADGNVTGYILEARLALQNPAKNDNVYGMELQLNDAKGGNRTGTLNVFDKTSTAYISPTLFGKVVLSGKAADDVMGFNKYDLLKMVSIANDIELVRYTDETAAKVNELVAQTDAVIATGDQAQVDALCSSIDLAIKALVHKDIKDVDPAVSKIKEFRRIPADYLTGADYDASEKGTVVREFYDTYEYSDDGEKGAAVKKDMLVYLPAGYKAEDKNKRYNVLYLIHGTSENQNTVFGSEDPNVTTVMKKVMDKMIANGELDPMIVVTPGYQGMESGKLQYEIVNEILPFIAEKYNTYSASGSQEDLKAARSHRAVGGFSQGSGCTFTIMKNRFDYFKYYLPVSAGPGNADFTSVVKGYAMNDYYVFASTGTDDIAYSGMVNAIPAMADQKDSEGNPIFIYNADLSVGNLYLLLLEDGTHTWQCVNQYLYNILPDVFFAEKDADVPVVTDENGFTSEGRIVGNYGTPNVDGEIDDVWNKAVEIIPPHTNNANVKASATFKVLWDDSALYFLAQVKDPIMSLTPSNNYEQDSVEIFLDELNDKTKAYGSDDLHFRVNYDNIQSFDKGDGSRFYTATKKGENEYVVEGRVQLQDVAKNGTVYGIELQVNDCTGSNRAGTITVFDTTDGAWDNTGLFGEIILAGKKPGEASGINPYKLKALVNTTIGLDVSSFTKGVGAFTARLDVANVALKTAKTQAEIDSAYSALNDVLSFMGIIKKYAAMNLDAFEGGEAVKNAVAAAEDILAKSDATPEEMTQAGSALNAAIAGLGTYSLKDVYADKFYIGAAVHLNGLADTTYTNNLLAHYNSITAENDMKPEVLLDQTASQATGKVVCNFTQMDQYCDFAVEHGLKMRGHTFVWHSQTPSWFFKENFDTNGAYVDVATMNIRLQDFMNQVFGHIKEKYPDLFYAYDVCNEVVSSMSIGNSNWKTVYGDYSFVTKAFEFARKASEGTGIKLYYNDYNCYDDGKPEKILELVADAKAAGNIDGIGMQSHVNTEFPTIERYRETIEKFVAAGYDVQITELDIAT
ncbi:MAG: sugar-binding protein, partial [Clostridiales bacterium]|nr:sugar-binding protein [Clostridiales bacterium]